MALDLLLAALGMAASPFALVGYIALGVVATSAWRAIKYGFLWGLAVHFIVIATNPVGLENAPQLAITGMLRLVGALIVTLGVFYLYRLLRRGRADGGAGGRGGGKSGGRSGGRGGNQPPHLRRVK